MAVVAGDDPRSRTAEAMMRLKAAELLFRCHRHYIEFATRYHARFGGGVRDAEGASSSAALDRLDAARAAAKVLPPLRTQLGLIFKAAGSDMTSMLSAADRSRLACTSRDVRAKLSQAPGGPVVCGVKGCDSGVGDVVAVCKDLVIAVDGTKGRCGRAVCAAHARTCGKLWNATASFADNCAVRRPAARMNSLAPAACYRVVCTECVPDCAAGCSGEAYGGRVCDLWVASTRGKGCASCVARGRKAAQDHAAQFDDERQSQFSRRWCYSWRNEFVCSADGCARVVCGTCSRRCWRCMSTLCAGCSVAGHGTCGPHGDLDDFDDSDADDGDVP